MITAERPGSTLQEINHFFRPIQTTVNVSEDEGAWKIGDHDEEQWGIGDDNINHNQDKEPI